jgi:Flp pilus assembly protein TadG
MSVTRVLGFPLRRLNRDQAGGAAVTFALLLPALMTMTVGILEMVLVGFDWHRATEATRQVARMATIAPPVPDLSGLPKGNEIVCTRQSGSVDCGGVTVKNPTVFDNLSTALEQALPQSDNSSLELVYANTGLGDASSPGGILPVVTTRLLNVNYTFRALQVVPGVPDQIQFPPFATTQVAGGKDPNP